MYRAVIKNDSNEIIAIGNDEGQGGNNYNDIGTWSDFTFDKIPSIPINNIIKPYKIIFDGEKITYIENDESIDNIDIAKTEAESIQIIKTEVKNV